MIRLPLVLVSAVLGGLAIVGLYEWFGAFVAGLFVLAVVGTWFEIRLSHIAADLAELEITVGNALERVKGQLERLNEGRCGSLAPMAYPGSPGTTACELTHGHASEWHRGAPLPGGLPGMEWRNLPDSVGSELGVPLRDKP